MTIFFHCYYHFSCVYVFNLFQQTKKNYFVCQNYELKRKKCQEIVAKKLRDIDYK